MQSFKMCATGVALLLVSVFAVASPAEAATTLSTGYDFASTFVVLNGSEYPHVFVKGQDNGLYIGWNVKPSQFTWPTSLTWTKVASDVFSQGNISTVTYDSEIYTFYLNNYQTVSYLSRVGNWTPTSLGFPAGVSTMRGPSAVTFVEGGVRKIAVFALGQSGSTWGLYMRRFRQGTGWESSWIALGVPSGGGAAGLNYSRINATATGDGLNAAAVSVWTVASSNRLFENGGTFENTAARAWTQRTSASLFLDYTERPGAVGFHPGATPKTAVTVVDGNGNVATYTREGTTEQIFTSTQQGARPSNSHLIKPTTGVPSPLLLTTSVFERPTGPTRELIQQVFDPSAVAPAPKVTTTTIWSGLDNVAVTPNTYYTNQSGNLNVFVIDAAGNLWMYNGVTGAKTNYGHP
jgi:hypothetical protein